MALVSSTLENTLKGILADMQDGSKSDAWMGDQIGGAISEYIGTGQVATVDTGTAPTGSYSGAGMGTMAISAGTLKSKLTTTFEARYSNEDLAAHIAADIDEVCTVADIIKTTTSGMVATPAGPVAFSGAGKGSFTGTPASIESTLATCFSAMNSLSQGGDDHLAAQLASAIHAYLTGGSISVTLQSPFTEGSAEGGLV